MENRQASDAFLDRLVRFHNETPGLSEENVLEFDGDDLPPRTMMVRRIQQVVCREFNISMLDLISLNRKVSATLPRFVAYYLASRMTMLSLTAIGRKFNGRDHATIHHGVKAIKMRIGADHKLAETISRLEEEIR